MSECSNSLWTICCSMVCYLKLEKPFLVKVLKKCYDPVKSFSFNELTFSDEKPFCPNVP